MAIYMNNTNDTYPTLVIKAEHVFNNAFEVYQHIYDAYTSFDINHSLYMIDIHPYSIDTTIYYRGYPVALPFNPEIFFDFEHRASPHIYRVNMEEAGMAYIWNYQFPGEAMKLAFGMDYIESDDIAPQYQDRDDLYNSITFHPEKILMMLDNTMGNYPRY